MPAGTRLGGQAIARVAKLWERHQRHALVSSHRQIHISPAVNAGHHLPAESP